MIVVIATRTYFKCEVKFEIRSCDAIQFPGELFSRLRIRYHFSAENQSCLFSVFTIVNVEDVEIPRQYGMNSRVQCTSTACVFDE